MLDDYDDEPARFVIFPLPCSDGMCWGVDCRSGSRLCDRNRETEEDFMKTTIAKKPDKKKIELNLRCILNDEEKLVAGKEMADARERLTELEGDLKRITGDLKAQMLAEESKVLTMSSKIRSGYEFRNVRCEVEFNEPAVGRKTVVRLDTNEIHEVRDMTPDENQRVMEFQAEEQPA